MGGDAPRSPLALAGSTCNRKPLTSPPRAIARAITREGRTTLGVLSWIVLHKGDVTRVNIESIVIAVVGAIIVLFVWRALTRNRASSSR